MQKYVGVFFLFMWCLPAFAEESVELSETVSELPLAFVTENTLSEVAISYSWGDFLMEKSCQEDFNKLQNKPFLTEAESKQKEFLQKYCLQKTDVWQNLLNTFYSNKRSLLLEHFVNENGRFMGYIKAMPFLLFDWHNKNPEGHHLFATLDKIQNTIQNKNPQATLQQMQNLSPEQQLFLMPVFNMATDLLNFQDALKEGE